MADIPCAITVATAAPEIPILKAVINNLSKKIFIADEITKNINGIKLFPIALNNPAKRL